jgi:TatD DNase family protein
MHTINHFDIHGHLNFPEYDVDRAEVIERARSAGIGMITVGTDIESSKKAIELAEQHEGMWTTVGIHPTDVTTLTDADFESLKSLAAHPKVVAIGECGLDYFHCGPEEISKQREIFEKHIALANEVGKPLMLHVRNAKPVSAKPVHAKVNGNDASGATHTDIAHFATQAHNAYQEAITLLKEKSRVPANFHFFAGTLEDARAIVEMGNTMSFTGVLTFARNYDEVVRTIPLESMMTETDCPYVAPVPNRGKRNEPSYVLEVIKKIAEIRGDDFDTVAKQLRANVKRVFGV